MKRLSFARAATLMAATVALVTGLFAAFPDSANAQTFTGIRNTKHNLSSSGPSTRNNATNQGEVCVFCHTPHGSSATAAAPLWNRAVSEPSSYDGKMYDSQTFDGASSIGFISSSVSLACLSCHDGSQAMDTVLNAPGSGGYNGTGIDMGATFSSPSGTTGRATADGKLRGLACLTCTDGGGPGPGGDLKNDHPVGMEYAKWGAVTLDPDFRKAEPVGTKSVWYVESGKGGAGRDKQDMYLYTRNVGGTDKPFVECASCHDPHVENATFLRIPNTDSDVCLTCHTK